MTAILLQHAERADAPRHVATDVTYLKDRIVNVVSVGAPGAGDRVSRRTLAITGLALGAAVGLAVLLSRRDRAPALTDTSDAERLDHELGIDLASADGGYDAARGLTSEAPPSPS